MLAEALGIETEANWDAVAKKRNMQRYGSQGRRARPAAAFNIHGTGTAQRQGTAAGVRPDMTPRMGGLQIPAGKDVPGQGNPLMAPPKKSGPLGAAANSPPDDHGVGDQDWLSMLMGDDNDDEDPTSGGY